MGGLAHNTIDTQATFDGVVEVLDQFLHRSSFCILAQRLICPSEQDEEYEIKNGERLPHIGNSAGEPVSKYDSAIRNLQQDAVGNQTPVPRRIPGYRHEHDGKDD